MHKNTQRILSKTLFDLRKKSKLTPKAIDDVMGISVAMYSKIELGERTVQEKHILKLRTSQDCCLQYIHILSRMERTQKHL